jgi:putative tryptophan/tyrosine transport system substrate-binding protein
MSCVHRRQFIALLGLGTVWPLAARAQQQFRIGVLNTGASTFFIGPFKQKLEELGYAEGKNLIIEFRFSEGRDERYASFASELVALPVELLVAWGTPAAIAAKNATSRIPVVITVGDVINTGLVSDLAHPGGNITGFVALNVEIEEKRFELLKEVLPRLSKVAVLSNRANPLNKINSERVRRAAERQSIAIDVFEIQKADEVEAALAAIGAAHPDAVIVASDTLLLGERKTIAAAMSGNGIPAIYPFREYADVGGFVAYGANISALFERSALYVQRILNGESPGNLPVQQATTFDIIINLKAAARLGLTLPPSVLARADEVIE